MWETFVHSSLNFVLYHYYVITACTKILVGSLTAKVLFFLFTLFLQATLSLAMDILLSEENGWVELQQGVGRLINAIVAVLGPELAPGSIFFSRCKVSYKQFP